MKSRSPDDQSSSTSQILAAFEAIGRAAQVCDWSFSEWSHIELGAANYGLNIHADKSHPVNVNQVAPDKNQFNVLFTTLDDLIDKKGLCGTFYLNDLHEADVMYALNKLQAYLDETYPLHNIELQALPGDFFIIDLPNVNSIHLKNPEMYFFDNLRKPENLTRLQYIASKANESLQIATYYKFDFFRVLEKQGVACKAVNYHFAPYIHADGTIIEKYGSVILYDVKSVDQLTEVNQWEYTYRSGFQEEGSSIEFSNANDEVDQHKLALDRDIEDLHSEILEVLALEDGIAGSKLFI